MSLLVLDTQILLEFKVRLFVPLCITDEEAEKIINKDKSAS
ncbi:XkdX family protein [Enterococcus faecium]|nr:XkdX family protein [Enterococcus faecium]EMF0581841.1 XkdX family protein [Enterococcus faecium]